MSTNIENFNPQETQLPLLDSPRSLEAWRRTGVHQRDLLYKPKSVIRKELGKQADKKFVRMKFEAYEQRRQNKVQLVQAERKRLIKYEDGTGSIMSKSRSTPNIMMASSMLDVERRILTQIERKTQNEIQQMITNEQIKEEARQKAENKQQISVEKEAKRMAELAKKHKAQEKRRQEEELRKRQIEEEENQFQQRVATAAYQKQQKLLRDEEKKNKKREKEAKRRAALANQKAIELQERTAAIFEEQQHNLLQKKSEMDRKDSQRLMNIAKWQKQKRKQSEEKSQQKAAKLQLAQTNLAEIAARTMRDYQRKEQKMEQRRQQFEEDRQRRIKQNYAKSKEKEAQIASVLENNQIQELTKKHAYEQARAQAEQRKQELDEMAEYQRKVKRRQQLEKEAQRVEVLERMKFNESNRVNMFMQKRQQSDAKLELVRQKSARELEEKRIEAEINREEKEDNVKRIQRAQEYQRELVMQRIIADNQRSESLLAEKAKLVDDRRKLRDQVETRKAAIMADFDNTKSRGNLISSEMSASQPIRPQTASYGIKKRKRTKNHVRAKSSQGNRWKPESRTHEDAISYEESLPLHVDGAVDSDGEIPNISNGEEVLDDKSLPPIEHDNDLSPISQDMEDERIKRPKTARQRSAPFDPSPRFNCYIYPTERRKPRPVKTYKQKSKAKRKIEKLRTRQNNQLLIILKREQEMEEEREEILKDSEEGAREVLEKQFGVQRAQASARIVSQSEKYNKALKKLAKKLGVELRLEN